MKFNDKIVLLEENPRKGFCKICGNGIGDEYINYKGQMALTKQTHIHHIHYDEYDYLKDTMELCASCHRKISLGKLVLISITK
jgi:hypothetical protein